MAQHLGRAECRCHGERRHLARTRPCPPPWHRRPGCVQWCAVEVRVGTTMTIYTNIGGDGEAVRCRCCARCCTGAAAVPMLVGARYNVVQNNAFSIMEYPVDEPQALGHAITVEVPRQRYSTLQCYDTIPYFTIVIQYPVDQPHEFGHDVAVEVGRTEGMLSAEPSRREDDEIGRRHACGGCRGSAVILQYCYTVMCYFLREADEIGRRNAWG